jgi:hypothetical protein
MRIGDESWIEIRRSKRSLRMDIAIAFVISKAVGLKAGTASADYIHLYHGNASLLAESLGVIQQTSVVILAALQPPNSQTKKHH